MQDLWRSFKTVFPNREEMFTAGGGCGFPGVFPTENRGDVETVLERSRRAVMTLTFKAFLAASASDRLSKLTNPTGWGDRTKERNMV